VAGWFRSPFFLEQNTARHKKAGADASPTGFFIVSTFPREYSVLYHITLTLRALQI
jgi:hypothetical protein